jgi:FkbM family methyltransferase
VVRQEIKNLFEKFGVYFSRQPKKHDNLISNIRNNLVESSKVLHIGAHFGQEIGYYEKLKCTVIWVEANPQVFQVLKNNLRKINNQTGVLALLGDKHNYKTKFYLANNQKASSSIYDFGRDVSLKNLKMTGTLCLDMKRLDKIFNRKKIKDYNHWVIDVQGAELDVFKGAGDLLNLPTSIEVEVSTREEYLGGAKYRELKDFLRDFGFLPLWDPEDNSHENIIFVKSRHTIHKPRKLV